jgi:ribulose-5-phosphate 4-epimerase/fuculose-1-phosphate aldolase
VTAGQDELDGVRADVVRLGRRVVQAGLVVAMGGNVSARRPGSDVVVVTPTARALDELTPAALPVVALATGSRCDGDGDGVSQGDGGGVTRPTTELALHLAVLRARPDVTVALHLHPPATTLLHALGIPIRALTTDHALALARRAELPYLDPGSDELADAVAGAVAAADVVLLRHHGCVVVADSADVAFSRAANVEAAAEATYRAHVLGDRDTTCPPRYLEHLAEQEARGIRYGR